MKYIDGVPYSGVAGVTWKKETKKWLVSLNYNKKRHYLGVYKDLDEAVMKRYEAEQTIAKDLYLINSPAYNYLVKHNLLEKN